MYNLLSPESRVDGVCLVSIRVNTICGCALYSFVLLDCGWRPPPCDKREGEMASGKDAIHRAGHSIEYDGVRQWKPDTHDSHHNAAQHTWKHGDNTSQPARDSATMSDHQRVIEGAWRKFGPRCDQVKQGLQPLRPFLARDAVERKGRLHIRSCIIAPAYVCVVPIQGKAAIPAQHSRRNGGLKESRIIPANSMLSTP